MQLDNLHKLSGVQLSSLLCEENSFSSLMKNAVHEEFRKRKISDEKLEALLATYSDSDDLVNGKFEFNKLNLLLIAGTVMLSPLAPIIMAISILAIKFKHEKGRAFEAKVWNYFQAFLIFGIMAALIYAFTLSQI